MLVLPQIHRFYMILGEVLHRVSRRFFEVDGVERAAQRRFTFRVSGFKFRVSGFRFRVLGSGFQVSGFGF